jgi:hypothetical protein
MRRREFITLLGGATIWPLAAHGQQPKLPTIGFLGASTAAGFSGWVAAFTKRLHELGWTRGVPLRSSIVGRRDAASATVRSHPNSSG